MCPACWAIVAMVTASVASTGALGALGVIAIRSRTEKPVAQTSSEDNFGLGERRHNDEHGD